MATYREITLSPNGFGAQPYLSRDLLDDSRCPLTRGEACGAHVIDGVGILLAEADSDAEYDIEMEESTNA